MANGTIQAWQSKPKLIFDQNVTATGSHTIDTNYTAFILKVSGNDANARTMLAPVGQPIEVDINATSSIYLSIKMTISTGTLNISSVSYNVWGAVGVKLWGVAL